MMVSDSWSFGAEPAPVITTTGPAATAPSTMDTVLKLLTSGADAAAKGAQAYAAVQASKVKPASPIIYQTVAPTSTGMSTMTMVLLAGGAVAVLGLLYFATRK